MGQRSCTRFTLANDSMVEQNVTFTFQAMARNLLDVFRNNESMFSITINGILCVLHCNITITEFVKLLCLFFFKE